MQEKIVLQKFTISFRRSISVQGILKLIYHSFLGHRNFLQRTVVGFASLHSFNLQPITEKSSP